MVKLTNPLNRDGILYKKGALLTLSLKDEQELIANGLAETYPLLKTDEKSDDEANKEDPEPKKGKKTSTCIGRTSKK